MFWPFPWLSTTFPPIFKDVPVFIFDKISLSNSSKLITHWISSKHEPSFKAINLFDLNVFTQPLIDILSPTFLLSKTLFILSSKEREVPEYIQLDNKNKTAKLVRVPKFAEVPFPVIMEPSLVIEYYSR